MTVTSKALITQFYGRAPGFSYWNGCSDPDWDWRAFNVDRDMTVVDERLGPVLNAIEPDLSAFKARSGKLILFHGWNDTLISPRNTVNYYSSVLTKMGSPQDSWLRLFMAPGMNHCGGGVGPNTADWLSALEGWRESDLPPDRIVATRANAGRTSTTRPVCPYPQVAQYLGTGSTDEAANFVCRGK
jgi:feruloyl esterase